MSEIADCPQDFLEELTTAVFSNWTSNKLFNTFKNRYQDLTKLSRDFFNICFKGIQPNQYSIYLTNEKMKQSLLGYDEWAQFIPTGNVGLHHKFKMNAGVLSHIIKRISLYESNEEKINELNETIQATTEYHHLNHMLEYGMFFLFFFCFFFFLFFLAQQFFF